MMSEVTSIKDYDLLYETIFDDEPSMMKGSPEYLTAEELMDIFFKQDNQSA